LATLLRLKRLRPPVIPGDFFLAFSRRQAAGSPKSKISDLV